MSMFKSTLNILLYCLCATLALRSPATLAQGTGDQSQSVRNLRMGITATAEAIDEGEPARANTAAWRAVDLWKKTPPAIQDQIERAHPGTALEIRDLPVYASRLAQLQKKRLPETTSRRGIDNGAPRPEAGRQPQPNPANLSNVLSDTVRNMARQSSVNAGGAAGAAHRLGAPPLLPAPRYKDDLDVLGGISLKQAMGTRK